MPKNMNTAATLTLSGSAETVNEIIVLAISEGVCIAVELADVPRTARARGAQREHALAPVAWETGMRVESRGMTSRHNLKKGQQGTITGLRDMGARGLGLFISWDDEADRGTVGSTHVRPVE